MDFIKINTVLEYVGKDIEITLIEDTDFEVAFKKFWIMLPKEQEKMLLTVLGSDSANMEYETSNEIDLYLMSTVQIEWKKENIHLRKCPLFSIREKTYDNGKLISASLCLGAWYEVRQ